MYKNLDRKTSLFEEHEGRIFFTGESMLPVIKPGCRLKVEHKDWRDIYIGDIVLFDRGKEFICHRVVGKYKVGNRVYFLEKGDNAGYKNVNIVRKDKVIGKVTRAETFEGRVFCPGNTISKTGKARLQLSSFIFGLCHSLKRLYFGDRRNSFTRKIRSFISRIFA